MSDSLASLLHFPRFYLNICLSLHFSLVIWVSYAMWSSWQIICITVMYIHLAIIAKFKLNDKLIAIIKRFDLYRNAPKHTHSKMWKYMLWFLKTIFDPNAEIRSQSHSAKRREWTRKKSFHFLQLLQSYFQASWNSYISFSLWFH